MTLVWIIKCGNYIDKMCVSRNFNQNLEIITVSFDRKCLIFKWKASAIKIHAGTETVNQMIMNTKWILEYLKKVAMGSTLTSGVTK